MTGLNYRETRLDFDYGGRLTDTLRYHIGGFVKDGHGPDHIPFNAVRGYQIKGNVTKELPDGYIRLNFKRLDDREPTNTSQPSLGTPRSIRSRGIRTSAISIRAAIPAPISTTRISAS